MITIATTIIEVAGARSAAGASAAAVEAAVSGLMPQWVAARDVGAATYAPRRCSYCWNARCTATR